MAWNHNLEIISKETIKPSSPTPSQLKSYNLTFLDQYMPSYYIPYSFFFTAPNNDISSPLKTSLSDTLVKYYPFAGRLASNGTTVDCNDQGSLFLHARIDCELNDMLKEPEDEITNDLFASGFLSMLGSKDASLLAVQLTTFKCGGISLSLCVSHKIADGFGTATFINDWAKVLRGESISPQFISMSLSIPPLMDEIRVQECYVNNDSFVTKRFVFSSSSLTKLKAEAASSELKDPTRVESVTVFLYKTVISARSQSRRSRMSVMSQTINMRAKLCELPFSKTSIGNLVHGFKISAGTESKPILNELTKQFRQGVKNATTANGERLRFNHWISERSKTVKYGNMSPGDIDIYHSSAFCRFRFYEVDYGWGKPLWVKVGRVVGSKNSFVLMDSRDGQGIEALVSLGEDDMEIFKHDKELLNFASLNPSVV